MACRHVAQVQSGCTGAAYPRAGLHDLFKHLHVAFEVVALAEGETGTHQGFGQSGALAHAQPAVIEIGATAFGGMEQVVARGVVHHRLLQHAPVGQGDAHRIEGKAVDEVGRPVQRVDDPGVFAVGLAVLSAAFLGQDPMVGVGLQERFDDGALSRLVHFGDEVVGPFAAHLEHLHVE